MGRTFHCVKITWFFFSSSRKKIDPINWQPPKSRSKASIKENNLILEIYRRTPKEKLEIEIEKVHFASFAVAKDHQELELAGHEKNRGDMIMKHPLMIESAFTPTIKEYNTEHGFIDILGKDKEGNLMVSELKCRKSGVNAVKQIKKYLKDFEEKITIT